MKEESFEALVTRLSESQKQAEDQTTFMDSEEGLQAALSAVKSLKSEAKALAESEILGKTGYTFRFEEVDNDLPWQDGFRINVTNPQGSHVAALSMSWVNKNAKKLEGSSLGVSVMRYDLPKHSERQGVGDYYFFKTLQGEQGWRDVNENRRSTVVPFSSEDLANNWMKALVNSLYHPRT